MDGSSQKAAVKEVVVKNKILGARHACQARCELGFRSYKTPTLEPQSDSMDLYVDVSSQPTRVLDYSFRGSGEGIIIG